MGKKKAGTVPVRFRNGEWQVLLVEACNNPGMFVLPKGSVEKGEKKKEAAQRETLEEAGVLGRMRKGSMGVFEYERHGTLFEQKMWILYAGPGADLHKGMCGPPDGILPKTDERWKERNVRPREWFSFQQARTLCACRKENVDILRRAEEQLGEPEEDEEENGA